jgi:hypothetical protein
MKDARKVTIRPIPRVARTFSRTLGTVVRHNSRDFSIR